MGNSLLLRIAAGLVLAGGLLASYIFYGTTGLVYGALLVSVLCLREYRRMVFFPAETKILSSWFWGCAIGMIVVHIVLPQWQVPAILSLTSLFLSGSIILSREMLPNESLLKYLCLAVFGFFYCVFCPLFAVNLLYLEHGAWWFLYLLIVVFSGDTFAFFGGLSLGKHKLNPSISPKKTVEGAIAGVGGSLIASLGYALYFYPGSSLLPFVLFGVACGVVGQTGDLLVSLVKRVHNVKDSGRMIPGHGGVLDRVDGVLIACPLVYTFALLMH